MAFVENRCPECGGGGWVINSSAPYGRSCRTCKKGRDKLREAAPDLLAALKKAIEALERADDSFGVPGLHGIINEADAAIRKAGGDE